LLTALLIVLGACGSGGSDDAAVPQTVAPTTTDGVTTTRPQAANVATEVAETQTLGEYVADYYAIAGDLAVASGQAFDNAADPELYAREVSTIWQQAADRLGVLDPPPSAADAHEAAVIGWSDFLTIAVAFEEGVTVGGSAVATAAEEFSRAAFVQARALAEIDAAMAELASLALDEIGTDVAGYMAAAWRLRSEYVPLSEEVVSVLSDPTLSPADALDPIGRLIDELSIISAKWTSLSPPEDVSLLHDDQGFVIDGTIRLLNGIVAFYSGESDELDPDMFILNEDLTAASAVVNAGWAYATSAVLRGGEDAVLAYAGAGVSDPLPVVPADADVFALAAGDCFNDVIESQIDTVPVVDCADPHDNEVYHVVELTDAEFPGDGLIDSTAGDICLDEFAGFIGISYEDSEIFASWLVPTASSWGAGDRAVVCFVWHPDRQVTGTLRDAGV
jgi:hypothetical protein